MENEVTTATEFEQEAAESSEPVVDSNLDSSDPIEAPEEVFEKVDEEVEEQPAEDFAKKEEQEEKENDSESDSEESEDEDKEEEDEDEKKKYSLLEQQYNDLQTQYNELKTEYDALVEFKNGVENERKDALINNDFYMLSEEDKKDVIEHKAEYTLDEIKAKLAVICYEKKVNFNSETSEKIDNNTEQEIVTFNYGNDDSNLPDWVKAVKNIDSENN